MEVQKHIRKMKNIYHHLMEFIDKDEDDASHFSNLIILFEKPEKEEIFSFLNLISKISKNHHKGPNFNKKIEQILDSIFNTEWFKKKSFNFKLFDIFGSDNIILNFLIEKDIIELNNHLMYDPFFTYPEKMLDSDILNKPPFKKDPSILDNFDQKRRLGENDSYICSLIRGDLDEEFIEFVNKNNVSIDSLIGSSIFETNSFLIQNKETHLIEYAAFFGSVKIFKFLLMQDAKLAPNLWLYAIHGRNCEIIHLLEERKIVLSPYKCFIEAVKCHHNEIVEYLENNHYVRIIFSHDSCSFYSNVIYDYYDYHFFPDDGATLIMGSMRKGGMPTSILSKFITKITIPNTVKKIEFNAFNGCQYVREIVISPSVTIIEFSAFKNCSSLSAIEIPSTVSVIQGSVFQNCTSLETITLPPSISSISDELFSGCKSLRKVSYSSNVTAIGSCSFNGCSRLVEIDILPSVKSIGERAFEECSSLKEVTIPQSVVEISKRCFDKCTGLQKVTFQGKLTRIGSGAFQRCSSLSELSLPPSLKTICDFAFRECCKLSKVTIPDSVNEIWDGAFMECTALTQLRLPPSVTIIDSYLFNKCTSLNDILIPPSVTLIGGYAFRGCSSLLKISLPPSLTSIGGEAFKECTVLKKITIPSSVTKIGKDAFDNCSDLAQITLPSSLDLTNTGIKPETKLMYIND